MRPYMVCYASYAAELAADPSVDAYTRVYDPLCQTAASYAVAAGVQQFTAERFVEYAVACMERVPAVGRLLRAGLISAAWFRRVVEQTALVEDPDVLAFIDAEIAHRLTGMGGLSAKRVEAAVAAIVAEHDRDAATLTREEVSIGRRRRWMRRCGVCSGRVRGWGVRGRRGGASWIM